MPEPVILLHSGGMSGRQWRKLAEALRDRYPVVAPDFLGSGANPIWPEQQPFHFHQDVEEIERRMEGPAHLVGHSYGGLIALTLARRNPDRVVSLAVYDPVAVGVLFAAGDREGLADLDRVGRDPIFADEARGGGEEWMTAFVDYWNGPGYWRALPQSSRQAFLQVGRKVYYEVRSLTSDRTGADGYRCLNMPVLLVHGEKSPLAAIRVSQLLAQALPLARLESLPGAGHMGPLTHAAAFQEKVEAHLQAVGR